MKPFETLTYRGQLRRLRRLALEALGAYGIMDLRDLQMMLWAIEMRDHPGFRDRWEGWVKETLEYIKEITDQ